MKKYVAEQGARDPVIASAEPATGGFRAALGAVQTPSGAQRVIAAIRAQDSVARIDIARLTGLSPATVTGVTSQLMAAGLVEESPDDAQVQDMRRGRPRVALQIRGAARVVLGVKLSDRDLSVAVLDFRGATLGESTFPLPAPRLSGPDLVALLARICTSAAQAAGLAMQQVSAVGIGLPGFVDAASGLIYWCPVLAERRVDLTAALRSALGCPVFLDNDANMVAVAEQWFGFGRDYSDFVTVTLEHGIGMGVVIGGQLYRGARGRGAEFGHIKVARDGALCRCGQRGCLEAYVGDYALLREAGTALGLSEQGKTARLEQLQQEAEAGNRAALGIFRRAGRMFALGLANVVNIFDPEVIILSGSSLKYHFLYDAEVLATMRRNIIDVDDPPEVLVHKWGDLLWARGAAAMALERVTAMSLADLDGGRVEGTA